jgi:hypothetical protein
MKLLLSSLTIVPLLWAVSESDVGPPPTPPPPEHADTPTAAAIENDHPANAALGTTAKVH